MEESIKSQVQTPSQPSFPIFKIGFVLGLVLVLAAGIFTGNRLVQKTGGLVKATPQEDGKTNVAVKDVKTFRDYAKGVVKKMERDSSGQILPGAEGTHLLIREDAPPANLISSVVDLDQFVGKKVEVWGETQRAQRAGWLLDVGRIAEAR